MAIRTKRTVNPMTIKHTIDKKQLKIMNYEKCVTEIINEDNDTEYEADNVNEAEIRLIAELIMSLESD